MRPVRAFSVSIRNLSNHRSASMNRSVLLLVLLLGLTTRGSLAQTGEDVLRYSQRFPAVGARMTGMAGAGVAGVNSWGAAFANPAGLGLIPRSHVSGSFSASSLDSEADYFGDRTDRSTTQSSLGSAAYVASVPTLRGAFVLGVGYNQTAGFDRQLAFSGFNPSVFVVPDLDGEVVRGLRQRGDVSESGVAGELSLAGAVEVAPRVLAGLSLNLITGHYQFEHLLDEETEDGMLLFQTDDYLEADLRGVNLRVGVAAEVAPGFRLGLAAETPTYYRVEEGFDLGNEFDIFDYSITTPWRISGGIAYEMAGFLLAADLEFLDWSQARLRPTDTFLDEDLDIRRSYREVVNTRFGAEYAIGPWAVRAGAAYQPDPLRDVIDLDRLQSTYTVGFSLQVLDRTTLDVAYAFTEFDDQIFPADEYGVVTEHVIRNRFLVGVQVNL